MPALSRPFFASPPERRRPLLAALACAAAAWPATTMAAGNAYIRQPGAARQSDVALAPMIGYSGWYGLEAGAKADYLLADPAFIPALNNSVFLEGSVFVSAKHLFAAPLLRWDFHLHPQWTLYGEAGLELDAHLAEADNKHDRGPVGLVVQAGAIWRLPGKSFVLRGEIDGTHDAVRIGPMLPL